MRDPVTTRVAVLALLPFLVCVLVLDVSSMWRMSATYDESAHLDFGRSVLDRGPGGRSMQRMAISAVSALPSRVLDALDVTLPPRAVLLLGRLPSVVASLGLLVLVFWWARQLYGLRGALLSAALYTVCPTILAHSRLATNDVFTAGLTFAATLLFVRWRQSPTLARLVSCAAVTGLAQIAKHTALLLVPVFAVLWAIDAVRASGPAAPGRMRRTAGHLILGVALVLVIVNAGYLFRGTFRPVHAYLQEYAALRPGVRAVPALASMAAWAARVPDLPVPLPYGYVYALVIGIYYNATGSGHGPVYLLGEVSHAGWPHYYLVAFALKEPLALTALLGVAAVLTPAWLRRRWLDEWALLIAPAAVFAFFSLGATAQIGIRYVLPAFPFLLVALGKVAVSAPRRGARAYHATLVALVVWAAASSLSYHPHYLAYFNELIGDRKNMWRYLADSNVDWGQNDGPIGLALARAEPICLLPPWPVTGRVIVNVNGLVGVTAPREQYAWLRERHRPVDHIGYSWLIYEIARE